MAMNWHRSWEGKPFKFTVWVVIGVVSASLFEIIPTFVIESNVPKIASVKPYTPLELAGRDIYIEEGCYNCHSQMVRPLHFETERFGEYSKAGEFVYDHPFQWGSRRLGPDLHRIGVRNPSAVWHLRHFDNPQETSVGTMMPSYKHLLAKDLDFEVIPRRMTALKSVGVPYTEERILGAAAEARAQAADVGSELAASGQNGYESKKVVALIAYLQRLGTDITKDAEGAE
jgi:cytochrome c oxidase cbb3-type subunit I/II